MKVEPITPKIGAIVTNINLKTDLTDSLIKNIRDALCRYEVIFFKQQPKLTSHEYIEIAGKIWEPLSHPFISGNKPIVPGISPFQPYEEYPEITGVYHNRESKGNLNEWHSDLNWLAKPSYGSMLRATLVPPVGGDTLFASMTSAYEDLSDELKEKLKDMRAYHDFTQIYEGIFAGNPEGLSRMQSLYPAQAHPVILSHPITGKKSIFVNRVSTSKIQGLSDSESKELLEQLYKKATIPEYQVRYRWEENDIALWDNLATQHYAVSDYWPAERKMERISLAGIQI